MEVIQKESAVPLHAQLAELLRTQIRHNQLQPGDQLPSERELCEQFSISRITVRKALSTLTQEGLVYSTVGKGSYVSVARLREELQPLSSFTQDMQRRGMHPTSKVLQAQVLPADEDCAARLLVPAGSEVVRLSRLRLADGLPIAVQLSYLPHNLCPDLLRYDFATRSLFEVLRNDYRLQLTRASTVIRAALALPSDARLLKLSLPAAVLISEQTTSLENGAIIEYAQSIFHGERYQLYLHA